MHFYGNLGLKIRIRNSSYDAYAGYRYSYVIPFNLYVLIVGTYIYDLSL